MQNAKVMVNSIEIYIDYIYMISEHFARVVLVVDEFHLSCFIRNRAAVRYGAGVFSHSRRDDIVSVSDKQSLFVYFFFLIELIWMTVSNTSMDMTVAKTKITNGEEAPPPITNAW